MKARPILFSSDMVRALLAGTKTQTRRAIKPQPKRGEDVDFWDRGCSANPIPLVNYGRELGDNVHRESVRCPYGKPGDLLYVRESLVNVEEHGFKGPVYAASDEGAAILDYGLGSSPDDIEIDPDLIRQRPSIHMPRAASRLTLRTTEVRVQRLQDISEVDALAEGIDVGAMNAANMASFRAGTHQQLFANEFMRLWWSINGRGSWDANPWVWVLSFEVIKQNVDVYLASLKEAA